MAVARSRYDEHSRWEHFVTASDTWIEHRERRAFLAEARHAASQCDDETRLAVLTQLDLAARLLDERDPFLRPELLIPEVRAPKADELIPFLDGWEPWGPTRRWNWKAR
ncbi:hypothetical protein EV386_1041 [Xylanimonas ulmi]|uniref:Uncharacterized protein n=2 Tax=Xylanimonas ulmi TaxID=228973 RepID=A0A4Q7M0P9_9MICO|nr:hypothetical protein EV386_1041 [Xylanibacterium ulmi]